MVYKPNKALSRLSKIVKKTVIGDDYGKIIKKASSLNSFKDTLDNKPYNGAGCTLVDDSESSYTITYTYNLPEEDSDGSFGILIEML